MLDLPSPPEDFRYADARMSLEPYTTDTSTEAENIQHELVRRMTPSQRAEVAFRLTSEMIRCSKDAIRRRYPEYSELQRQLVFVELHYGAELAASLARYLEMMGRE